MQSVKVNDNDSWHILDINNSLYKHYMTGSACKENRRGWKLYKYKLWSQRTERHCSTASETQESHKKSGWLHHHALLAPRRTSGLTEEGELELRLRLSCLSGKTLCGLEILSTCASQVKACCCNQKGNPKAPLTDLDPCSKAWAQCLNSQHACSQITPLRTVILTIARNKSRMEISDDSWALLFYNTLYYFAVSRWCYTTNSMRLRSTNWSSCRLTQA